MDSKVKVAFCFSSQLCNIYGGGEEVLSVLLGKIDLNKFDVTLVIETPKIHDKYLANFKNKVKIISIYNRWIGYYKKSIISGAEIFKWKFYPPSSLVRKLARAILYKRILQKIANEFDVIVDHDPFNFIKNLSRFKILPKASIVGWHHTDYQEFVKNTQALKKVIKNPLLLMDGVFFVSSYIQKQSIKYIESVNPRLRDKTYFTPNGINIQGINSTEMNYNELNANELQIINSKYILMVARVTKTKGHSVAIEAFCKIQHLIPEYNLVFVGPFGDAYSELMEIIIKENMAHKIHFLGAKTNPYVWMKNSQMLILCSLKEESFGLVIVEASIFNKVVIVSDLPQLRELYSDKVDYFITGNAVSLGDKILSYIDEKYAIHPRVNHLDNINQIIEIYSIDSSVVCFEKSIFAVLGEKYG